MNLKNVVQGFGAAILVMILRVWPLLSRYHPVIYHSFLPMRSVVWGILIDLGVFIRAGCTALPLSGKE